MSTPAHKQQEAAIKQAVDALAGKLNDATRKPGSHEFFTVDTEGGLSIVCRHGDLGSSAQSSDNVIVLVTDRESAIDYLKGYVADQGLVYKP